ncbi:MAG: hypothetical protein QF898_10815 [SAR202 cluster bacterium]|nr:hypothetical protein [SAR202 cluster bacterium]
MPPTAEPVARSTEPNPTLTPVSTATPSPVPEPTASPTPEATATTPPPTLPPTATPQPEPTATPDRPMPVQTSAPPPPTLAPSPTATPQSDTLATTDTATPVPLPTPSPPTPILPTPVPPTPIPSPQTQTLKVVDENDYWVAYESPTENGLSLAWGDGFLWMSDLIDGEFIKTQETSEGLEIVKTSRVARDPFGQARDMAWDGNGLWSIDWGSLLRHDMSHSRFKPNLDINDDPDNSFYIHHMKGIAWDGQNIWSSLDGGLYRHSDADFTIQDIYPSNVSGPAGMAFKGNELWVADRSYGFVTRLDMSDIEASGSPRVVERYSIVEQPFGITWSEENLWLYDWLTNRIS